jgi:hypothetical protein
MEGEPDSMMGAPALTMSKESVMGIRVHALRGRDSEQAWGTLTMARGMMPCPSGPLPPCIVCVLPAPVCP